MTDKQLNVQKMDCLQSGNASVLSIIYLLWCSCISDKTAIDHLRRWKFRQYEPGDRRGHVNVIDLIQLALSAHRRANERPRPARNLPVAPCQTPHCLLIPIPCSLFTLNYTLTNVSEIFSASVLSFNLPELLTVSSDNGNDIRLWNALRQLCSLLSLRLSCKSIGTKSERCGKPKKYADEILSQ